MSETNRHDELESLIAPWVLGALETGDAETVRSHVEGCPGCRDLAAQLRRVVGALPLAAAEVAPPPRLRERILAAAGAHAPAAAPTAVRPRRVAARRAWMPARMPAYAMAAIILVALLVGVLVGQSLRGFQQPPQQEVARFTLAGHGAMSGAQASVVDLKADGVALVDFRGLPPPQQGKVYELWLIRGGASPVPAGVFVPDANGSKVVIVERSLAGYSVMAVTMEAGPDGASAPTQQPELSGNVA